MFRMVVEAEYNFGDIVYLKTDEKQLARIVTSLRLTPGNVLYGLAHGTDDSNHYAIELSRTKNSLAAANPLGFNKE